MKKFMILIGLTVLSLVACGGSVADTAVSAGEQSSVEVVAAQTNSVGLNEDYPDAVSVQTQLILGILKLDDSLLAVDEEMANELLPLWQAMQSLSEISTTASVETTAVLNQIQDSMLPEQIEAIVAMQLTDEDVQTILQESGGLRFGGRPAGDGEGGQAPGGGQGRPAGGLPGGGGQGPGGFGGGNVDPSERETRIAERFGEGVDPMAQLLLGALIRNLEVTAGLVDEAELRAENGRNGLGAILPLVAEETDLSVEDVRAQLQEGNTFAEIITNNGGDVDAIAASLLEQFSQGENFDEEAARTQIEEMLNGGFGQQPVNE